MNASYAILKEKKGKKGRGKTVGFAFLMKKQIQQIEETYQKSHKNLAPPQPAYVTDHYLRMFSIQTTIDCHVGPMKQIFGVLCHMIMFL